ncbi:hypothetical protein BK816_00355 [Boudabousia tangfeifanii]|uniref:ABC transporter permease n=1 Tax=Boudabousia tangfeifanii TaxID=1912795 RepID=A0A1D9MIB5_9ACTO|nr:hypothetical protein [Boudabousia tangfeifanii]AOZ71930.1 hypothetical protein BK816_00355 [Boudabousia tangfeifanii]
MSTNPKITARTNLANPKSGSAKPSRLRLSGPAGVGLSRARRRRGRLAAALISVLVATATLLSLAWIQWQFSGQLADTVLGQLVSLQVRSADLIAAAVLAVLAAVSVGVTMWLGVLEDASIYATLRAIGWPKAKIWLANLASAIYPLLWGYLLGTLVAAIFPLWWQAGADTFLLLAGIGLGITLLVGLALATFITNWQLSHQISSQLVRE